MMQVRFNDTFSLEALPRARNRNLLFLVQLISKLPLLYKTLVLTFTGRFEKLNSKND